MSLRKLLLRIQRVNKLKKNGWKRNSIKDGYYSDFGNKVINEVSLSELSDEEFDNLLKRR